MFLIELAFQGVQGLPPVKRVPLQAGLHVISTQDPELGSLVFDAMFHTLYPDPGRAGATSHLVDPSAAESRVAVTYYGRDKSTYRLIRNLGTGGVKLYQFQTEKQKYRLLTDRAQEAAQFVRVQEGLPDDVTFERLFCFEPNLMPTRGGQGRSGAEVMPSAPPPSAPGMPGAGFGNPGFGAPPQGAVAMPRVHSALAAAEFEVPPPAASPSEPPATAEVSEEDKRKAYERALDEYQQVAQAELAQAEVDQLQSRRFELADEVEAVTRRRMELQRLDADLKSYGDLEDLPDGFSDRLATYSDRQSRFESEMARHRADIARLERELENAWVDPLSKDPYFLGGCGAAGVALGAAVLSGMSWIALLNLPAAMVAAGAALRWVYEREKNFRAEVRVRAAGDREERIEKQHQLDTSVTRRMMDRLGVSEPGQLLERVEEYENKKRKRDRLSAEIQQQLSDGRVANAERELKAIEDRSQELESLVLAAAGSQSSARALRQRVATLGQAIGAPPPPDVRLPPPGVRSRASDAYGEPRASTPPNQPMPAASSGRAPRKRGPSLVGTPVAPPPGTDDLPLYAEPPVDSISQSIVRPPSNVPELTDGLSMDVPRMAQSDFSSFVSAADPLAPPPARAAPAAPGRESSDMFDFGGSYIGGAEDEDDEEGYGSGYGTGGGSSSGGGKKARGYWASGSSFSGGGMGSASPYSEGGLRPDRSRQLFQAAQDLMGIEADQLMERLRARMAQYLGAITSQRYEAVQFGARGEISVGKGDAFVAYPDLSADALDAVDLAVRLCLVESVLRRVRVPILMRDPCVELSPQARALFRQMLGYLGRAAQVLVMTSHTDIEGVNIRLDV